MPNTYFIDNSVQTVYVILCHTDNAVNNQFLLHYSSLYWYEAKLYKCFTEHCQGHFDYN